MKTKLFIAVLIAGLAATGRASAQICSYERLYARTQGDAVTADFSNVDTRTCALGIETTVHVEGNQGVRYLEDRRCGNGNNGFETVTTEQSNSVTVFVSVYDRCLATQLLAVSGTGEAEDLHLNNNFKTGSLRATIEGLDDFNQPVSIELDLVWTRSGQKERTVVHVNTHPGAFRMIYTSSGTIRDAIATGSVLVDGTDMTPLPSSLGTLEKRATRGLEVYR